MATEPNPIDDVERIRAEREMWHSLADMLAYTLAEKAGAGHQNCDPETCAIRFVLAKHAEATF